MTSPMQTEVLRALCLLPSGLYVMTSAFEGKRAGVLVKSVQACADEPLLISVAARKGHWIEPMIRDSHCFAICRIDPNDKLVVRKFMGPPLPGDHGDPFDAVATETLSSGAPIIKRSILALDCEVVRHFDLEADHEIYVGQVLAGKVYAPAHATTDANGSLPSSTPHRVG